MSVYYEKKDHIITITIDRPAVRNAIDFSTAQQLSQAFRDFDNDPDAYVAVLYGVNGHFCAGADLKTLAEGDLTKAPQLNETGDGPLGISRMQLSKPVIAAIAGYAVAGGMELALWADLRVMEEDAVLGIFCRRWGVPLVDGGTIRLPRLIGLSRAMDLILTGRPVEAKEALDIGLANRVVKTGTAREEAEKLAKQIAGFPQTCLRNDRMSAYDQFDLSLKDALQREYQLGKQTLESGETFEGAAKFTSGKGRGGSFEGIK
ncbi:MAG TPA: crotonase/enoyl-CoA hydratase family protein [Microscillaceae bacterium]|nr:crotonase/enoyl-CoA hydratase family protein [Microscillaceae bacterium]